MCKYSILASCPSGAVRYCHHCQNYNVYYGNIVVNFSQIGFEEFKENVAACYEHNVDCSCSDNNRGIFFNTRIEGLQFVFSVTEISELLSMLQTASLEAMTLIREDHDIS